MKARIQKLMSEAGICSRRKAEEMIKQGLVIMNGEIASIGDSADLEKDKVIVNGERIKPEKKIYLMLHKPAGYITTADDPWGRKRVLDLLHVPQRVFPVGRLDKDASGLLLLTNDGEFSNRVMHPRYQVEKTYEVVLDRRLEDKDFRQINDGIMLDRKKIKAKVWRGSGKRAKITVHTGLNKEIKRIFKSVGYWVRQIKRTQIGSLRLNVKEGKTRKLLKEEIEQLLGQS